MPARSQSVSASFDFPSGELEASSRGSIHKSQNRVSRWAVQEIEQVCDDQVLTEDLQALPQVAWNDVQVKQLLGQGGFCNVYEVQLRTDASPTTTQQQPLALKQIKESKRRNEEGWVMAVFDLCNEASLLAKLNHTNIVRIKGVCHTKVSTSYRMGYGYFFLMEKLDETLFDRLRRWRSQRSKSIFPWARFRRHSLASSSDKKEVEGAVHSTQMMHDRLSQVAMGVARAMSYLHAPERTIALRDLKPQNIGFDSDGQVKLFDFGMARPLQETLTELAGTFRYLSPEVIMGYRVGLEADVYSFGVILYELATLDKPYDQYFSRGKMVRRDAFREEVSVSGWRPDLQGIPCRATRRLIANCWQASPRARPTFRRVVSQLEEVLSYKQKETPLVVLPEDKEKPSVSLLPPSLTPKSFQGLRPLPRQRHRGCSDVTDATTSSNSGRTETM
eukprot:Nitzschia sp. Nitz4//scaffold100_size80364//16040//17377//NITZ4_005338-RA/size80364-processed-gene-0.31-mRNA-1//1//CDS//3329532076//1118//frame0